MDEQLYKKLDEYADKFGDIFPMMQYDMSFDRVIKLIDKCIKLNKPVQEIKPLKKDVIY